MIQKHLFQWMKTNPALQALFGDRFYHEWAPQNVSTWPLVTFRLLSGIEVAEDMEDEDGSEIDSFRYEFQVAARKSIDADIAAIIFDREMRKFRGTMGAVKVQRVEFANRSDLGEIIGDKQVRKVALDYSIFFTAN